MPTPTNCPNCDYPIGAGRHALCPNCRYPLILEDDETSKHATAGEGLTRPTRQAPAEETTAMPVVTAGRAATGTTPHTAGGLTCPSCGHVSAPGRQRCERCATSLRADVVSSAPTPTRRPAGPSRTTLVLLGALLLALAVGALAAWVLLRPRDTSGSVPVPASPATTEQSPVRAAPVDRRLIRAVASSELPSASGRFAVVNTLDGDPTTVWNSNGKKIGPDGQVSLTYTFSRSVDLRRIDIAAGSQKSPESFADNGRPRQLAIRGAGATENVELRDVGGTQRLDIDLGATSEVTITISSVYRDATTKFPDLAISDVTFFAAG